MTSAVKSARVTALALLLVVLAVLGLAPSARAQFAGQATWGTCAGTANAQTFSLPNVLSLSDIRGVQIGCVPANANTGATTLTVNSLTATTVEKPSSAAGALVSLVPGDIFPVPTYYMYDGTEFVLVSPLVPASTTTPAGRLTLTSGSPVMSGTVSAATTLYYTPYVGSTGPLWTGSYFANTTFSEVSQALSDTTKSPDAAVAASVYDVFIWNDAGTVRLSRGPVWTNVTTRSAGTALTTVSGLLVNAVSITNGPAAGFGTFVGTAATDASGATVTFNPYPAAASGGPTNGAWIGLWNQYNRVTAAPTAQDSKSTWTTSNTSWERLDVSSNNRVTFVSGGAEDSPILTAQTSASPNGAFSTPSLGIGLDSTTAAFIATVSNVGVSIGPGLYLSGQPGPLLGEHFAQALQASGTGSTTTYTGAITPAAQVTQISAQLRY